MKRRRVLGPSPSSHLLWKRKTTKCASDWPRPTRHPVRQSLSSNRIVSTVSDALRRFSSSCCVVYFIPITWPITWPRFRWHAATIELESIGEWLFVSFQRSVTELVKIVSGQGMCRPFWDFIISIYEFWNIRGFSESVYDILSSRAVLLVDPFLTRSKAESRKRWGDYCWVSIKNMQLSLSPLVRTRVEQQN